MTRTRPQSIHVDGRALLPLRLFLGVTYCYAGLQKLSSTTFFGSGPDSLRLQLQGAARTSPIHAMVTHLVSHASVVGLLIAFAELAVGLGALTGLFTRIAAAGGLALAAGFLLTVSWHTSPYYLGPDIVFVFAWVPLVIAGAGSGTRLSADAYLAARERTADGWPAPAPVVVDFATVQRVCGGYDDGRCRYRHDRACAAAACPAIASDGLPKRAGPDLARRAFLRKAQTAGALAAGATVLGGFVAVMGHALGASRAADGAGSTTTLSVPTTPPTIADSQPAGATPTTAAPTITAPLPRGTAVGLARDVPVGGAAQFVDPASGSTGYVLQPTAGAFRAFSAVCTHQGCTVKVQSAASEFYCPCHGARFSTNDGAVLQGPARRPLPAISVAEGPDGRLYVDG